MPVEALLISAGIVALAARFDSRWQVVAGTTLGMLAANAPVIWLGGSRS